MAYYVTYKNKTFPQGIIEDNSIHNMENYILTGGVQLTNRLKYIPERYSYKTNGIDSVFNYFSKLNRMSFERNIIDFNNYINNWIESNNFSEENKENFYKKFQAPKRNGRGFRQFAEPINGLKEIQRSFSDFLINKFKLLPHEAAHGFTEGRDPVTNAKRHQHSKHVINIDLQNFFPSITKDLLLRQLNKLNAFWLTTTHFAWSNIRSELITFLRNLGLIAIFEDGLPQGSPLSPLLSNLVMVQFDYEMTQFIKDNPRVLSDNYIMYTRYADDMSFSSLKSINLNRLLDVVNAIIIEHYGEDTIKLHPDKIKYLTTSGKCYITGVKINQNQELSLGYEEKQQLKHDVFQLFMEEINDELDPDRVKEVLGMLSWFHRIEPNYHRYIERKYLRKFHSQANSIAQHFSRLI